MWASATSSDGFRPARPFGVAALLAAALAAATPLSALDLPTAEEALGLAFPGVRIERESVFLEEEQVQRIAAVSGVEPPRPLVTRFTAADADGVRGWAYLDTHRVRTLPESLLVILDASGKVLRVEVVAFREPPDYLPPEAWYAQFEGRGLDEDLRLKRGIRPITGATLTTRATTDSVRRVLALHGVLSSRPGKETP